jgi:hypothetical protein
VLVDSLVAFRTNNDHFPISTNRLVFLMVVQRKIKMPLRTIWEKGTDVSEEHAASNFRAEEAQCEFSEPGTKFLYIWPISIHSTFPKVKHIKRVNTSEQEAGIAQSP